MARRRKQPYCPVLSTRAPVDLVAEITREARRRKISKSHELMRRLDFYAAAQKPAQQSATTT